jgi:hypothetical protein
VSKKISSMRLEWQRAYRRIEIPCGRGVRLQCH